MLNRNFLKRVGANLLILLVMNISFAAARATEGDPVTPAGSAESHPAGSVSTPRETQPAAPPATPIAPILLELQQLKEKVEGQSEQIAKQSLELESERAAVRDELDKIVKLESELRVPTAGGEGLVASAAPTSPVLGPGSAPAAAPGSDAAVQVVQQQAPPGQGSVDRRLGDLEQRLKKLGPLSFSGDFRFREDAFFGGPSDHSLDQNLQNYRLRFNVDMQLSDDLSGGFTLASGNINDPTSTNQTLTGFYARKPIALDRAFIQFHPNDFKPLTLVAGKFTYSGTTPNSLGIRTSIPRDLGKR